VGGQGFIHREDPFRDPEGSRGPARRLRGRLVAPVTVWTAGAADERTGLTVASTLIAEGEPSFVLGLINDLTDLYERIVETEGFVVHVATAEHRVLADRFAGLWPSPGGLFADLSVEDSRWGPLLNALPNRARCRLVDTQQVGYARLVRGEIEGVELADLDAPLAHFRGRYRGLEG
jgi:3-hydroxy-9,10-secoandrosta-1,3,5(10)-triene-9,17-dione monooxygenase reductase component